MNTYVILHTHRFGSTPYVFKSNEVISSRTGLTEDEIITICKHFGIDYEPDRDDLELISNLKYESIPEIKFRS